LPAHWTEAGFDDSGWASASDGGASTTIALPTNSGARWMGFPGSEAGFRRSFASAVANVALTIATSAQGQVAIYLNQQQIGIAGDLVAANPATFAVTLLTNRDNILALQGDSNNGSVSVLVDLRPSGLQNPDPANANFGSSPSAGLTELP
jgi:hypothetical protein